MKYPLDPEHRTFLRWQVGDLTIFLKFFIISFNLHLIKVFNLPDGKDSPVRTVYIEVAIPMSLKALLLTFGASLATFFPFPLSLSSLCGGSDLNKLKGLVGYYRNFFWRT